MEVDTAMVMVGKVDMVEVTVEDMVEDMVMDILAIMAQDTDMERDMVTDMEHMAVIMEVMATHILTLIQYTQLRKIYRFLNHTP